MQKLSLLALAAAGVSAGNNLDYDVSLKGVKIELSKEQQNAEWQDLKDEAYNKKGFYQWKPVNEGFILLNKDSNQLQCHMKMNQKTDELNAKVGFDCDPLNAKDTNIALVSASSRFRNRMQKFSPVEYKELVPLNPEEALAAENARIADKDGIDDGIPSFKEQQDFNEALSMMGQIDFGNSQEILDASPFMHNDPNSHSTEGIDAEANQRLTEFFKNHPQYISAETRYLATKLALDIAAGTASEQDENYVAGEILSDINEHAAKYAHMGEVGKAASMWKKNNCNEFLSFHGEAFEDEKVGCESYVVGPLGYWGCQWLYEDGTCGYIRFYPAIRWDGLEAKPRTA